MNTSTRPYRGGRLPAEPVPEDGTDPGRCLADGCPLRGSVDLGMGGRFYCACHAYTPTAQWGSVTQAIHDHAWMVGFMRELRRDDMLTEWRQRATDYWRETQPEMIPHADESRAGYLYRLHLDLLFRVGARASKPGPLLPQGRALHGGPRGHIDDIVASLGLSWSTA